MTSRVRVTGPMTLPYLQAGQDRRRSHGALTARHGPEPRPELLVVVAVRNGSTRVRCSPADGAKGRDMREAMVAAAEQYGMPVVLPTEAALAGVQCHVPGPPGIARRARSRATAARMSPLSGTLTWNDTDLGWDADWQMTADGVPYRWRGASGKLRQRLSQRDRWRGADPVGPRRPELKEATPWPRS